MNLTEAIVLKTVKEHPGLSGGRLFELLTESSASPRLTPSVVRSALLTLVHAQKVGFTLERTFVAIDDNKP